MKTIEASEVSALERTEALEISALEGTKALEVSALEGTKALEVSALERTETTYLRHSVFLYSWKCGYMHIGPLGFLYGFVVKNKNKIEKR